MSDLAMNDLEARLKTMIVQALSLEKEISPEEIDSEDALFGEGLGLDSIDALELAIAIKNTFKIEMKADDEETKPAFQSVRTLAEYLRRQLGEGPVTS